MPAQTPRNVCLVLMLAAASCLMAQDSPARLPSPSALLDGFDAAVTVSGSHDSYMGWYNVVTPAVSYTFNPRYSADLSMSFYPYRLAINPDAAEVESHRYVSANGDPGDMLLEVHAAFNPRAYRDIATASMTLPTGNRIYGLGTGQVTFNVDNRVERYFGKSSMLVDIGGGDSAALQNRMVTEEDNSLGPLAQFQTGMVSWLSPNLSVQSIAYEQLPIGDQKTYATERRPPRGRESLTGTTYATGRRVIEDNGFNTTMNYGLSEHMMLTGSYNRSLRLHLDTVSLGVTFTLRSLPFGRSSLMEKAMREAERGEVGTLIPQR